VFFARAWPQLSRSHSGFAAQCDPSLSRQFGEDVIAFISSSPGMLMSNRSGKLFSTLLIASFAGGVLASTPQAPAHADDTCLPGPKATTPRGSHWYYRVEPGTKRHCWYLGEARGKTTQRTAAKHSSPAPAPDKPAETSAATPLQPSVANARAEFDSATATPDQATANPSPSDTTSSAMRDQATANPSPSDTALSNDTAQTANTSQPAVATRWPDPAISVQPPQPAPVAPEKPASQLLGQRTEPGPAVPVVCAPVAEASSYSMPMLLGGLAGALAFAGLLGFAVVKFGNLNRFRHIRRRSESIWDTADVSQPPPWQRRDLDAPPTPGIDPLHRRREIEAQSRDILELLSRASRGVTT
jgi:hypothetical protein